MLRSTATTLPVALLILLAYGDASVVDSWAAEYVAWAVKGGYMGKNTNVLTPLANMTRAEAAAMVVRYAG